MNNSLLICLATVTLSFSLLAQETKPAAPAAPTMPRPGAADRMVRPDRPRPQSGKVIGVDKAGQAITVGPMEGVPPAVALTSNVVVQVSTNTVLLKSGKRVTLDDIVVGDPVRFQTRKTPDGKTTTAFVVVGAPPTRQGTPAAPAPKK